MPVEIYEVFQSQGGKDAIAGKGSSRKLLYHVLGSDDDATIIAAAATLAPATVTSYTGVLNLDGFSKAQVAPGFWAVEASYIDPQKQQEKERPDTGSLVASWDTTGGTQHITASLETLASTAYSASYDAPDFKKAIEVTTSGVNGTDVTVPILQLEYEYTFPNASVTDAYIRKLRDLTGTTNDAIWRGWAIGDLLFLGSNGRQSSKGDITARFIFAAGKKITLSAADINMVDDLEKGAHDHLWYYFKTFQDTSAEEIVARPAAAYVERLYEKSTFTELGIGS